MFGVNCTVESRDDRPAEPRAARGGDRRPRSRRVPRGVDLGSIASALEARGVRAVALDLPSLAADDGGEVGDFHADTAAVRRLLDDAQPPVLLCGHSAGGGVITEAAAGPHPAVRRLVYVAAAIPASAIRSRVRRLGETGSFQAGTSPVELFGGAVLRVPVYFSRSSAVRLLDDVEPKGWLTGATRSASRATANRTRSRRRDPARVGPSPTAGGRPREAVREYLAAAENHGGTRVSGASARRSSASTTSASTDPRLSSPHLPMLHRPDHHASPAMTSTQTTEAPHFSSWRTRPAYVEATPRSVEDPGLGRARL